ncbi:MAG TPA: glycosyltransferase family 9 protein [Burkholderiales bacterium]|nr:glycosyltransferase family 9 protein [Burkholderiales bacterium]
MADRNGIIEGVRKIAVLRANALGDFVFTLPALMALRVAYPAAEIVLLALEWHREFLRDRPGPIDRVLALPPVPGVNAPLVESGVFDGSLAARAIDAFMRVLRAERFDLALQLHGGGRYSNPFVAQLGARVTAGLRADGAPPLDRSIPYVYFQPEIVRYLEVVGLVGAAPVTLTPRLELTQRDRDEASKVLRDIERPLALLHPGASDPRRRWPLEAFEQVGRALAEQGAQVLVNGVEAERALCDQLADRLPGARNLRAQLTLHGLAGVLARCAVVVSNDTGPLHLAAALGTRTVGIYWCFNLVNSSQLTRARHQPFVSWRTHCPMCGRDCTNGRCDHEVSFVAEVPIAAVTGATLRALAEARRERARPHERGARSDDVTTDRLHAS